VRILISGASGFIGGAVSSHFEQKGDEVVRLSRGGSSARTIVWDPEKAFLDREELEGFDVVIHLAGEPILGRWTADKKRRIFASRVESTRLLSQTLAALAHPPRCFLSASAVGYYGNRGEEVLTEESLPGNGFLSHVCIEWEHASKSLEKRGIRTLHTRFGTVLGKGGALSKLLLPYKLCLGGPLGTGQQWMSWVALEDLVRAIDFSLRDSTLSGPVNVVSPQPVRQLEFAHTLASLLHRPSFFPQPAWLLQLLFGDMAREVLLSSARVQPKKLLQAGFQFQSPDLKCSLQKLIC